MNLFVKVNVLRFVLTIMFCLRNIMQEFLQEIYSSLIKNIFINSSQTSIIDFFSEIHFEGSISLRKSFISIRVDGDNMSYCKLCNGMSEIIYSCPQCNSDLVDVGRIYDYFDDYSAYMDIDLIKLVDGNPTSSKKNECVHLFKCEDCNVDLQVKIEY